MPVHRDQLQAQHSVTSMGSVYLYLCTYGLNDLWLGDKHPAYASLWGMPIFNFFTALY